MNKIKLIKKIVFNKKNSAFDKYIIFFYEVGCYFQKKNKFIADCFFYFPYFISSFFYLKNLNFKETCLLLFSDKSKRKEICLAENYDRYFSKIKKQKLKIIEIGIGGHDMEDRGGSSLRSLAKYFKNSKIYGIDLINKKLHERKRIKTFKGSQVDKNFLTEICKTYGPFDIIIDDGSHFVEHQKKTFEIMFNFLNFEGIYIIEDVGSSYIKYLGGSQELKSDSNLINYFLKKTHNVFSYYHKHNYDNKETKFSEISSIQYFGGSINNIASILIEKNKSDKIHSDYNKFNLSINEIRELDPNSPLHRKTSDGVMKQKI